MSDRKVLEIAADHCKRAGAPEWEIYLLETERFHAEAKDGALDKLETSQGRGMGIRVRVDGKPGFSYTADFGAEAIGKAVEAAIAGARAVDPEPDGEFAPHAGNVPILNSPDDDFKKVAQSEKINRALCVEEAAKNFDKRVVRVRNAAYTEASRRVRLINHLGLERDGRAALCGASVVAVSQDGDESQSGWDADHSVSYKGLDCEAVGKRAASDAVMLLGAKPLPTQKTAVIFRNAAACQLLEVVGESFSGESVAKGRSMLAGKIGQKIFSDRITIIDDGILKGGAATFPFDGEGIPRRTNVLVEKGELRKFIYDLTYARKARVESTGNAARAGYTAAPKPAVTNLYIKPGNLSFDDMLKSADRGFLIAELMGVHTANPVTGDFSFGASGWLVESGKISRPVQGVTVAGNIIKLLSEIDAVGADIRFMNEIGAPSLRAPSLDIGGE